MWNILMSRKVFIKNSFDINNNNVSAYKIIGWFSKESISKLRALDRIHHSIWKYVLILFECIEIN